jgi:hypothetical protein
VDGHVGALRFCKDSPLLNLFCFGLCGRVAFKVRASLQLKHDSIILNRSS